MCHKMCDMMNLLLLYCETICWKKKKSPMLGQFLGTKMNHATCEMIIKHLVTISYGSHMVLCISLQMF
jgi:hypothetical protein